MRRLLVVLLVVLGAGCATLLDALKSGFTRPALQFRQVALSGISLSGLTLDTVWGLDNPNPVGLSLASVDYALSIDGTRVVSGSPPQGLTIPSRGTAELHFPASFSFADVARAVDIFLTRDTARWRAEGGLGISTPIGIIRVPLSAEGDFEVPKVPQVAFANPRVSSLGLTGATIEFPVQVTNRNTYALPVAGLSGALTIGGAPVGTLSTGDLGAVDGRGTRTVAIPLTINFVAAAGAVASAVRGGQAQLGFTAQLQSGPLSLPLRVDQPVTFLR